MTPIFTKQNIIANTIYLILSTTSFFLVTHIDFLGLVEFNYLITFLNGSQFVYYTAAFANIYALNTGTGPMVLTLQNTWIFILVFFIVNHFVTAAILNLISYAIKGKPFKSFFTKL